MCLIDFYLLISHNLIRCYGDGPQRPGGCHGYRSSLEFRDYVD